MSFWFAWVHSSPPRVRGVHWVTGGFTLALLVVTGFIGFRCGSPPKYRRDHSGSHGFTRALQNVAWFIRFPVGSLGRVLGSSGSLGFAWVHSDGARRFRVHWSSRGFNRALLVVAEFIGFRIDSLGRA